MELLEGLEFLEEVVEAAEELDGGVCVKVDDCGEGEAEEEVVCCAAGEFARFEGGHAGEVGLVEEDCVEPIYSAFVSVEVIVSILTVRMEGVR